MLAELLYKNDYAQANRTELLQAVDYFDSLAMSSADALHSFHQNNAFLAARAYYINGVGYYENDSAVEACKEYIKALEVMEECFEEKELVGNKAQFLALTCTHLTALYSDFYLHEQAISFGEMALKYYQRYESPAMQAAWVLVRIGAHYDIMEEWDSASCYYAKAIHTLNDTNTLLYRDIATRQVFLNYEEDNRQAASSIRDLRILLSKSKDDREMMGRSLSLGEIYYREKLYDSAWHYLDMVYSHSISSIGMKKQAAEWLYEISKTQGKDSEMINYADFLVPLANQEENASTIKSQLTELYKTFVQSKLDLQYQREAKRRHRMTIVFLGGLLIVTMVVFLLYHKNKRRKLDLETKIEAERLSHKMQQAALAGRLKRSNAALRGQGDVPHAIDQLASNQNLNKAKRFVDEPICQHILAVCNDKNNPIKSTVPVAAYANIALNDAQKAQLKNAAISHYGQLFDNLKRQFPSLKEKDMLFCYLSLLGLDNAQIAVLLQKSISTVWDRESRLKHVFNSDDKISVFLQGFMIN